MHGNGGSGSGAGLASVAAALRTAADPTRARILDWLAGRPGGVACVGDVAAATGLGQPTVSHHLAVLQRHGLVSRTRRGAFVDYRLHPEAFTALAEAVAGVARASSGARDGSAPSSAPSPSSAAPAAAPPARARRPLPSARRREPDGDPGDTLGP